MDSNEWYNIIQNFRNQKYYAPNLNLQTGSQSTTSTSQISTSNISNLVSQIIGVGSSVDEKSNNDSIKDSEGGDNIVSSSSINTNTSSSSFDKDHNDLINGGGGGGGSIGGNENNSITSNKETISGTTTSTISGDQSSTSFIIIDTLLRVLKNEKDDILRINLLIFLQENSNILLEDDLKRFERVFSILQSIIFNQVDSYPIKSQVLTSITSILICENLIKTNAKFIELFIELLLDIIKKSNNSVDRLLRGSACNCLLEFELTYPCLLSSKQDEIQSLCQFENSHLVQNYTLLLSTILQNSTLSSYEDANIIQNTLILNGNNSNNSNNSTTSDSTTSSSSLLAIVSPTTNVISFPISPINSHNHNHNHNQQQSHSHSSHSSIRSMMSSPHYQLQQQQQQQQHQQHSSSNNLNNLMIGSSSSQNSLNYGSSRRSTFLPLPNMYSEQQDIVQPTSTSFSIPSNVKYSPISLERIIYNNELFHRSRTTGGGGGGGVGGIATGVRLSESFEKEAFKCASIIADQSAYLNQWGLVTVIQQLIPLVDLLNIPHNFFKNHLHLLYKLFFTFNTVQFHIVLYLTLTFPDLYSQDELDYCLKRLISITNDISLSIENRILSIDWLLSLQSKLINKQQSSSSTSQQQQQQQPSVSIFQFYPNFYPTSFDSIQLKETKLYTLCKCLSSLVPQSNLNILPEELLKSLICLEEFKHSNESSLSTRIVFSCLLLFLSNFPIIMFGCVEKYLSDILINYPQFLNVIIGLLNGIQNQKTRINLFLSLSKTIVLLKPLRFLQYLPLVERVVVEDQIDPTGLLEKTYELCRRKKICSSGNWFIGNIILSICRRTLMYHHLPIVSKPLKMILSNLFSYFSNLEIRDRSSFYQRLITHLPDDKIKTILNTLQNDEANVSGLLSSPLTSEKNKLIKSVPNFISISQILSKEISNSMQPTSVYLMNEMNDEQQQQQLLLFNGSSGNKEFDIDFQNYLSILMNPSKLEAKIIIPYQIRYKKHIDNINSSGNSIGGNNTTTTTTTTTSGNNSMNNSLEENTLKNNHNNSSNSLLGLGSSNNNNNNNNINSNSNHSNSIPLKVYALLIQLQQSPYYSPIHPIRIPYLCHPNNDYLEDNNNNNNSNYNNSSNNNNESRLKEFPYCYDIDLSFTPLYPIPSSFSIKMIFNDDEGFKTCKSDINSVISIQLSNLFMKNPIPFNLKSNSINNFQLNLFNTLWSNNNNNNNNSNNSNNKQQQINNPISMTNSVKQFNISRDKIKEIINLKFENFIIQDEHDNGSSGSGTSENIEIIKVLIFLPPQFHLLFKFEIDKDSTIIYIKTDYWRCLVFLDQYLSSLFNLNNNNINNNNNTSE